MSLSELRQKAAEIRKAISTASTGVLSILAVLAPNYSEPVAYGVGLTIAILGTFVTYRVPNAKPKAKRRSRKA